jgi:transcriptional regulator with GAF, ATPase, and Fis domain
MKATQLDIERVVYNQKSLVDAIPEMVLLVMGDHWVEYMNPSAMRFFGDLRHHTRGEKTAQETTAHSLLNLARQVIDNEKLGHTLETTFQGHHLEYTLSHFNGYRGDSLYWFFIRDLTDSKRQLEELSQFHNSIETILSHKISELKESERTRQKLANELNSLKEHLKEQPAEGKMVGSSRALSELRDMVFQVAKSDATILITGESGTGKELVANLIRESSNRSNKPFLKINCNTINDSLLESDLFGHEKGAFTGADVKRKGKFEVVDGGTIFLDEIGELPLELQCKLLRVIQDGEFERLGSPRTIKCDVRIIAATNRNLKEEVKSGKFREDLYYRINVFPITMPALKQRKEDIPLLVKHFMTKFNKKIGRKIDTVSEETLKTLQEYNWPGNVRELESVIERAVITTQGSTLKVLDHFETHHKSEAAAAPEVKALGELEHDHISKVLQQTGWRIEGKSGAAVILGINASTLRARMRKLGIVRQ